MSRKKKTVYKLNWKNTIVFTVAVVAAVFTIFLVAHILMDYSHTKSVLEKIREIEIMSSVDDENTTTIKPDSGLSKFDVYWDYIKLGLIDVDMAQFKRINSDTIGYIEIKGTDYSFPVVQGENDFYKNHSFDKKDNSFGWIYLDEKSSVDELDKNTVIYGNKNCFGELSSKLSMLYDDEWKDDDDNYIIKYYTNRYSTLWQIISVYKTKDKEHLTSSFDNDEDFEKFIDSSLKKTEIKFKGYAKPDDKILTITTNSGGSNIVVQAKLIKIKTEN